MNVLHKIIGLLMTLAFLPLATACASLQPSTDGQPGATDAPLTPAHYRLPSVMTGGQQAELAAVIPNLAQKRAVFIGENHQRYDHHLNQFAIIQHLYEGDPRWVIGLEMFQQPFQPYLDAYVAGRLSEREFLEKTEYFQRWGFDYRLYRPILRYAKARGIPLVALNVPAEITRKVSRSGLANLNAEERRWVPENMQQPDDAYRQRLQAVFQQHKGIFSGNFEHFLEAQLLWDEAMAERIAAYLRQNPQRRMIVLAGTGHLADGDGIPPRLQQRLPIAAAVVLQADATAITRQDAQPASSALQDADYLLLTQEIPLPPAGRLGVMLDTDGAGPGMRIQNVLPESGARRAGLQTSDRLLSVADRAVHSMQDVRLALLDKSPGDAVLITIVRNEQNSSQEIVLSVMLQ
jgi:uncharacterized iron-regulated protein